MTAASSPLTIQYDILPDDYARACQARRYGNRWSNIGISAAGIFLCIDGALNLYHAQYSTGLPLLVLGAAVGSIRWLVPLKFRRDKRLGEQGIAQFSDDALIFSTPNGRSELTWNAYVDYAETKDFFLLYRSRYLLNFIPKRGISEVDQQRLRDMLAKHLIPRKRRLTLVRVITFWAVIAASVMLLWFVARSGR